jgi:hypothetical protein
VLRRAGCLADVIGTEAHTGFMRNQLSKSVWALSFLVIAGAVTFGWLRNHYSQYLSQAPADALSREIELDRKAGMPLEPKDIRPNPPIPDDQNAAPLYRDLFRRIEIVFTNYPNLRNGLSTGMKGTGTSKQRQDVERALASLDGTLITLAAVARKRPYCDFHYPFEQGGNLMFLELSRAKNAAKLLVAKAHFLGAQGRIADAYDLLGAAQSISRHVGQTPHLIAMLDQIAIDSTVMAEFNHLLQNSAGSAALLDKAQQTLDSFGAYANLRNAFGGEIVWGRLIMHKIHTMHDLAEAATSGGSGSNEPISPSMLQAFEVKFLSRWREVYEASSFDPNDWRRAYPAWKAIGDRVEADHDLDNTVTAMLFPVFLPALSVGTQQAKRNLAATSLRLMQVHLRTGAYPITLPAYGPMALDPFDGRPLRYRRVGAGFKIYSIGQDFKDHGGRPPSGRQHGDIVVLLR